MFKRSEEDSEKVAGGFMSKFGVQLALIAILSVAALSFFSLGMLKRDKGPELPKKQVQTAVSQLVKVPSPPSETDEAPPAEPAQPSSGAEQPATEPSTVVAALTDREAQATETEPVVTESETTDQPASGQTQLKAAAPPAPQDSGPSDQTPTEAKQLTQQPAFPPPESEPKQEPELVPKPLWQTVDQQWDTVKINGSAPDNVDAVGAAWKQIDVGQTDQVRENAVPEPVAAAEKAPTPGSKSGQTQVRPKADPKTSKTKIRPRTKKRYKSKTARKKSTSNKHQGVRLSIINESGRRGQAEVYRDVLRAMGYSVIHLEDRPRKTGPTTILYRTGHRSTAQSLSKRIPGQRTLAPLGLQSGSDIVIVVR